MSTVMLSLLLCAFLCLLSWLSAATDVVFCYNRIIVLVDVVVVVVVVVVAAPKYTHVNAYMLPTPNTPILYKLNFNYISKNSICAALNTPPCSNRSLYYYTLFHNINSDILLQTWRHVRDGPSSTHSASRIRPALTVTSTHAHIALIQAHVVINTWKNALNPHKYSSRMYPW